MNKFFNVGLPRTGTTSYSKALNLRGVYDLHYPLKYLTELRRTGEMQVYKHPTLAWRGLSHAHEHACEYQCLPKLYPGAKYALTTRSVDSWIESFDTLITKLVNMRALNDSTLDWRLSLIAGPDYKTKRDKERLREFFLIHDEAVRGFFGPDLLVLDLQEDDAVRAAKLNAWLGIDTTIIYPHLHDRNGVVPDPVKKKMNQAATAHTLNMLQQRGYTPISATR